MASEQDKIKNQHARELYIKLYERLPETFTYHDVKQISNEITYEKLEMWNKQRLTKSIGEISAPYGSGGKRKKYMMYSKRQYVKIKGEDLRDLI